MSGLVVGYTYLEAVAGKVKSLFFSRFFLVESNSIFSPVSLCSGYWSVRRGPRLKNSFLICRKPGKVLIRQPLL